MYIGPYVRRDLYVCNPKGLGVLHVAQLRYIHHWIPELDWELSQFYDFVRGRQFRIYSIGMKIYWGIVNDS